MRRNVIPKITTHPIGKRRHNTTTTTITIQKEKEIKKKIDSILFLSPTLWPEPNSSAAGVRTTQLLCHFANTVGVSHVSYGSGANLPSNSTSNNATKEAAHHTMQHLTSQCNISFLHIPPNNTALIQSSLASSLLPNDDNDNEAKKKECCHF
mmetsp:Transcript_37646/g.55048  ORF Transcript_37646/g.55048 Transcript_37646/m.55048 type:complete len:152 (-) Transcript_37646:1527-1982(-)